MIAHRGVSRLAPENTLPACELGAKYGYFGVECDLQETLDHEFILMHDETVHRMTNGTGKVSDYTLKELKQCLIQKGANYEAFPYLRIPTLTEYLQVCKRSAIAPIIEIKKIPQASLNRLLGVIKQWFQLQRVIIISFHEETLLKVRQLSSEIHLQWITKISEKNIKFCATHRMDINSKHTHVTEELVRKAHEENILVNVWTVNDGTLLRKLLNMGVDFITTDCLMQQQAVQSQESISYSFHQKGAYKGVINDKVKETLNMNLESCSWRWDSMINGIEIKGKAQIPMLASILLPQLREGAVLSYSFWYYPLNSVPLLAIVKSEKKEVFKTRTGLDAEWELIEFQGILTGIQEEEDYVLELRVDKEQSSHCLIKELKVKVQYI